MTFQTLLRLRRTWLPEDRAEMQIRSVAFKVKREGVAFEVEMTYAGEPGAVLDLGRVGHVAASSSRRGGRRRATCPTRSRRGRGTCSSGCTACLGRA